MSLQTFPRDLSWLSFNARVLQEASDLTVPIMERLKFLGIFSSNQDEFYRVRIATQRRMLLHYKSIGNLEEYAKKNALLEKLNEKIEEQQERYESLYLELKKELNKNKIYLIDETDLTKKQLKLVQQYFKQEVLEKLYPIIIEADGKLPYLKDKSIYLAVVMGKSHADTTKYALVEVPSSLPRFYTFTKGNKSFVIYLDDVIRAGMSILFKSLYYNQFDAYTIKLTRDSELDLLGDIELDILNVIKKSLKKRKKGEPVRLIYDKNIDKDLFKAIKNGIKLRKSSLIAGKRYHNTKDLIKFPKIGARTLYNSKEKTVGIKRVDSAKSILRSMFHEDILLHHPYHSFDYVLRFLREAAIDPKVTEIRITLYRLASNSNVVRALKNAVKNGKKVIVVMELQARFDEEANIFWANQLEEDGAKVIYGFPDKKVHTKLCLVLRKEHGQIMHYAHIGTGNYNENTAELYSDFGLLTCNQEIAKEANLVFENIVSQKIDERLKLNHLLVSPYNSRKQLIKHIKTETKNAKKGIAASMILKTNSLNDMEVIKVIKKAVDAGVDVQLITRSICCIQHQGEPNLKIISIVDKYLEHARIYWFSNNNEPKMFMGSADLMVRNLVNRFEILCPIYDKNVVEKLLAYLKVQLKDNVKARYIDNKQENKYQTSGKKKLRSQIEWRRVLRVNSFKQHL